MLAKRKLSCAEAKKIDIISLLSSLGHTPKKLNDKEAWYISPLRSNEKNSSFKVNRIRQLWYDFGSGKGGDIIDLGCLLYNCNITELLNILDKSHFSFHQQKILEASSLGASSHPKIEVLSIDPFTNKKLIEYFKYRGIDRTIAFRYCKQITYRFKAFSFQAIGFENNSRGWELRSPNFKGATHKDISIISNGSKKACVFEGFFDTLSFIQLNINLHKDYDMITLNSLSLIDKLIEISEQYESINLYLDNDEAGRSITKELTSKNGSLFIDMSYKYSRNKDLNDYLISLINNKITIKPV